MFKKEYSLEKEIELIRGEIAQVEGLKELVNHRAFDQIEKAFGDVLQRLTLEIDDLCLKDVEKKSKEISMKRWIAKYLGEILIAIRKPLSTESHLRERHDTLVEAHSRVSKQGA